MEGGEPRVAPVHQPLRVGPATFGVCTAMRACDLIVIWELLQLVDENVERLKER